MIFQATQIEQCPPQLFHIQSDLTKGNPRVNFRSSEHNRIGHHHRQKRRWLAHLHPDGKINIHNTLANQLPAASKNVVATITLSIVCVVCNCTSFVRTIDQVYWRLENTARFQIFPICQRMLYLISRDVYYSMKIDIRYHWHITRGRFMQAFPEIAHKATKM